MGAMRPLRWVIGATALALLSAACGSPEPVVDPGTGATQTTQPGAPTTAEGGSPSSTAAGGAARPSRPSSGGGGATGTRPTTASNDPVAMASRGAPGDAARVILQPTPAKRLVLEILSQDGAAPADATVSRIEDVLGDVTGKDVRLVRGSLDGSGDGETWSADEVRKLGASAAKTDAGGDLAVVRLLFLGGAFEAEGALGAAVRGDLAAIFSDQVAAAGSPLTGTAALERAVTTHEVGHLLGLVDLVLDTGRADKEHPGHSPNRSSVMYWAVESGLVAEVLNGPPPEHFDDDDKADLAALRAGR
jgi:hypothetical protein